METMLIATQSTSIKGAVKYFETVLTQGDYYLGTEIAAQWHGRTAELLGLNLSGNVTKGQFEALLSGKHPTTGKRLAQRIRQDRRPGVDFTFSIPKSVSLAWAINGDERIVAAVQQAVRDSLQHDIEPLVHRRVRDGKHANTTHRRQTGNLVYCDFLHKTSRPVAGSVDPHLHVHAFAVNLTADADRFFAAEFNEAIRQLPSLQAKFDSRLARMLQNQLGYAVEKVNFKQAGRKKAGWELAGVERSTIEKFSQRTAQVEAYAKDHGITDAQAKSKLGKQTREKKTNQLSVTQLRQQWRARLTPQERAAFAALGAGAIGERAGEVESVVLEAAVDYALEHHLYRQSTVEKHQVVGTALEHGLVLRPEQIEAELEAREVISRAQVIDGAQRDFITTRSVLAAEQAMIAYARDGRGTRYTLGKTDHVIKRDWLNDQQIAAVKHVLQSRDTVTSVTGGAGVGKTSLMKEAAEAIEAAGKRVYTFAPSTGARDVLQEAGFAHAQTVEHLIRNTKLHGQINSGDVLWVDEAGLLDVRSMNEIFAVAQKRHARVVLSGDTRQHSSPRRGEASRLLESKAGLSVVRVDKIQRQKGQYRKAVELISRGHEVVDPRTHRTGLEAGFDLLDKLGKIKEIPCEQRHATLAIQYIDSTARGRSTLVVAPTHAEGDAVTQEIRDRLREAGAIGGKEREFSQLRSLNLTPAEKGEVKSYEADGQVVQFHQNAKGGFKRGERYQVRLSPTAGVMLVPLRGDGDAKPLPRAAVERFEVYSEQTIKFAKGDKLRMSLGGLAKDGKRRFSNGRLDQIEGFDRGGNLRLKSGMTIDRSFGHWDHGFCITSHASQGKTTELTLAAMGGQSLPAINAKQFYVTVSRGSEDVAIYVEDKQRVRQAIQDAGRQLSATELVEQTVHARQKPASAQQRLRRYVMDRVRSWWQTHRPSHVAGATPLRQPGHEFGQHRSPKFAR